MDKQKLINKAVEDLKGLYANADMCGGDMLHYSGVKYSWLDFSESNSRTLICNRKEFTQRAKELGFVNGYQFGKEYPTNGKKPDLPKDLRFKVTGKMIGGHAYQGEFVVDECDWNDAITFRIIDDRYRPKQPESHSKPSVDGGYNPVKISMSGQAGGLSGGGGHAGEPPNVEGQTGIDCEGKIDNSWHEKGELPPAGVECEVSVLKQNFRLFEIRGYYQGKVWLASAATGDIAEMVNHCKFRPIRSERDDLILLIESHGNLSEALLADSIIAAGWSKPGKSD